jgi:hypothetical protein
VLCGAVLYGVVHCSAFTRKSASLYSLFVSASIIANMFSLPPKYFQANDLNARWDTLTVADMKEELHRLGMFL